MRIMGESFVMRKAGEVVTVPPHPLGLTRTHRTPWKEPAGKLVMECPLPTGTSCVGPSLIMLNMNKSTE